MVLQTRTGKDISNQSFPCTKAEILCFPSVKIYASHRFLSMISICSKKHRSIFHHVPSCSPFIWFKGKSKPETMDFPMISYGAFPIKFSLKPIQWPLLSFIFPSLSHHCPIIVPSLSHQKKTRNPTWRRRLSAATAPSAQQARQVQESQHQEIGIKSDKIKNLIVIYYIYIIPIFTYIF